MENQESQIKNEALSLQKTAETMLINSSEEYQIATEFLIKCRQSRKKIDEFCDPVISAAHDAHKAALAQKRKLTDPVLVAEKIITPKINAYRQEQDRIRRAEEERLRLEAQKKAEEERLAQAIEAEKQGDQLSADILVETPVVAAPVFVAPTVPKVEGISDREVWKFKVVNPALVPNEYKIIDESAIGKVVRALKDRTSIPGIQVYPEKVLSVRAS